MSVNLDSVPCAAGCEPASHIDDDLVGLVRAKSPTGRLGAKALVLGKLLFGG